MPVPIFEHIKVLAVILLLSVCVEDRLKKPFENVFEFNDTKSVTFKDKYFEKNRTASV